MVFDRKQLVGVALCVGFSALGFACKKKPAAVAPPVAVLPPAPPPAPAPEQPKEKPVYVYSGDKYRDPFTPAGQSSSYQPDAVFDPQRASVKGIIFGHEVKGAVLTAGGAGSYFVKNEKIFDVMGKPVEGYTAKVLVDKVILLGEADATFELKIKNPDQEAKSL